MISVATFHLRIVTPDKLCYDGEAERLFARTANGDVCILAHHIDYAAPLGIGEARVTNEKGETRAAACAGGLLSVCKDEVRVMATTFEWEDEIDLARAEKAQHAAEERLRSLDQSRADREYRLAEAKLKRAMVRIQVKQ